jgi:surfactin synthase thioesterase subunit/acyl carrier protein
MRPISEEVGLSLFDTALARPDGSLVAAPLDTRVLAKQAGDLPPIFRGLVRTRAARPVANNVVLASSLKSRLHSLSEAERHAELLDTVRTQVGLVFGTSPDAIEPERPLKELGLDSLMAVEIRNRLAAATSLRLRATLLFDYPTPNALAQFLISQLLGSEAKAPAARHETEMGAGTTEIPDESRRGALCNASLLSDASIVATPSERRWLIPLTQPRGARLRVICYPGAGGEPVTFSRFAQALASAPLDVLAVQMPGRGARLGEPRPATLKEVREGVLRELAENENTPVILLGHSMGASLAYDLAAHAPEAVSVSHVVVVAGTPPDRFLSLSDTLIGGGIDMIVAGLVHLHGRELAHSIFAADVTMAEQMLRGISAVALNIPMTAVWGEQDVLVSRDGLLDWVRFVSRSFDFRMLPCGHSPHTEVPEMLAAILRSAIHV